MFKVHFVILYFYFKERTKKLLLLTFCCFVFYLEGKAINTNVKNSITFITVNKLYVVIVIKILTFVLRFYLNFPKRVIARLYFTSRKMLVWIQVEIFQIWKYALIFISLNAHSRNPLTIFVLILHFFNLFESVNILRFLILILNFGSFFYDDLRSHMLSEMIFE